MGVQAEDQGSLPDPAATAALPVVSDPGQGVLFHDAHAYPTFGDTDKIPVVSGSRGRRRGRDRDRDRGRGGPGAPRWLRVAVVIVSLVILGAAAVLGLVKAGIIDGNGKGGDQAANGTTASTVPTHPVQTNSLLTANGTTASGAANYTIHQHVYSVTVTTSVGRSWVVIGAADQRPAFQGIVPPNSSQREIILGPAQVQIGAGGTKVIVTSGRHSQTLIPPSAPFSYQITPA
jgi:hypothetical protein